MVDNEVRTLVNNNIEVNSINSIRRVFAPKQDVENKQVINKARLAAKGHMHKASIKFFDTFSSVIRLETICT